MFRTRRRLLLVVVLVVAGCDGDGSQAAPPTEKPADTSPWQVRDTAADTASARH